MRSPPPDTPDEVIFEYTQIGNSMRVVAVDAATGTEVTVQVPTNLSTWDMQQLAMQKLVYVLNKNEK